MQTVKETTSYHNRNYMIDAMRLVASFFIICIHTGIPYYADNGIVNTMHNALCRFAVPFFFMITGYYIDRAILKKYIFKIIRIVAVALIVYYPIAYLFRPAMMFLPCDVVNLMYVAVFNEFPFSVAHHLWFLLSLLYGVPLLSLITKRFKVYHILVLAITLLVINMIATYLINSYYVRNVWLLGLPYMCLGYVWKENGLLEKCAQKGFLLLAFILATSMVWIEASFIANEKLEHYVFTPIQVFLYFLYACDFQLNM